MKTSGPAIPALALRPRERVRDGLRRVASTYLDLGRLQPNRPAAEQTRAVHSTRLILKRLRSLYRLLSPSLPAAIAERERERLRRAAAGLATAREAQASEDTLTMLAKESAGTDARAIRAVHEALAKRIPATVRRPDAIHKALARAVAAAEASVKTLDRTPLKGHGWRMLEAGFRSGYRLARKRFKKAHPTGNEDCFHAWRTAVKSLFYQLQLLEPANRPRLRWMEKALDRLQEDLGHENDLAVVVALVRQHAANPGLAAVAMVDRTLELLANRQLHLRKTTLKNGRRLFADRPDDFVDHLERDWKRWRK